MAYTPLNVKSQARQSSTTSFMAKDGQNLRELPQLLSPENALVIRNYLITAEGGLEKRKGLELLFDATSSTPITMLEKWTDDIFIFGYASTKVAAFRLSSSAVTDIKTDFNTNVTSGSRYGGYFFVGSPQDKIQRISQTLAYDAQTANFATGLLLTGVTSGATATILEDTDGGTTGTLTLGNITGTFQNNEVITDSATGSADANGTITFVITEITNAPRAKIVKAIDTRLFAGELEDEASAVQYSEVDDGTNPPFTTWTDTTAATAGGKIFYRNAGNVNVIDNLGKVIIVGADEGKWAFTIDTLDSGGTISKVDTTQMYRNDSGMKAALQTKEGLFYVNKEGLWQLVSVGQDNIAFSDQEIIVSDQLGDNFFKDIDLTDADIVKDDVTNTLLITLDLDSTANNSLLVYNTDLKAFGTFTGWNINRFINDNGTLYGGGSGTSKVWQLFKGNDDDGVDIWTAFKQELSVGQLWTRKALLGQYIQGELSQSTSLRIDFNIFDRTGKQIIDKISLQWVPNVGFAKVTEFGSTPWGGVFGGDVNPSGTIDAWAGGRFRIANFQRIIVDITENSKVPHTINWLALQTKEKVDIRIRNLTQN